MLGDQAAITVFFASESESLAEFRVIRGLKKSQQSISIDLDTG